MLSYDFLGFKSQNHTMSLFVRDLHLQALHTPREVWLPVLEMSSDVMQPCDLGSHSGERAV